MNNISKLKLGFTAVAIGCAGIIYLYVKHKIKMKNAADILDNMTIKVITTEEDCDKVISELRSRATQYHAIGFDCEWVTVQGKRSPVSLVQLSSHDGFCTLFRLCEIKTIPQSLKDLLEDEKIYKVGVAPGGDAKYLAHDYDVKLKGTLDIRHIAELCKYDTGGLAALSISFLNVNLDKSWRIRCSNWDAQELTDAQTKYAALDAYVAIRIFVKLINDYHNKTSLFSFWTGSNNEQWNNINELCFKYTDICFKTKKNLKKKNLNKEREAKGNKNIVKKFQFQAVNRSKPVYHNCFLQAPDGELLCTCDNKKAHWYVEKGLADLVIEDPLTVRLRFEPVGRSVGDVGRYYQLKKENKCVVCGAEDSFLRKNVVPKEYRKYFPEIMKDHSSHDVVLLCLRCHQRSNMLDQRVRYQLAERCNASLPTNEFSKYSENKESKKIRSAARALINQSNHNIPEERRRQLEGIILQHYLQHDEITEELLQDAANLQILIENADYESHGSKVVEYFMRHEGILRLEEIWREHFLDSMKPEYMPELWSLKHNEERLRVRLNEGRLSEQDLKLFGL